ncbi:16S rRNA (guanine(527)-N(7))-methyltransferase RsmG [Novispirillum itersonii]|uniref:16S rRNA (guanine(527)-N(7))-methyltransferase RsmG n=1 Tax=Novispirillum itersonii TaxID=189 RepID=UPI00037F8998|nr:16S rRNA (guanine(527)-N(7))-methyltransferase RsmG [Novispirillum itersonii]
MTSEAFQAQTTVSRETVDRLTAYADLLCKWQPKINLVGPSTMGDVWRRHFLDSAQLWPLLPAGAKTLIDFGSGAGFPGLVLAIMGVPDVHLVESDQRKCAFMREAARAAGVSVTIHNKRIEAITAFPVDVVSSRALAALPQLLEFAAPFLAPHTVCLFPKGQNVEAELTDLNKIWTLRMDRQPSLTDADATILRLSEVRREQPADNV